jgi:hypothetical protein
LRSQKPYQPNILEMAKRTLSPLQLAYREFFLATLEEYNVKSPASLNYEEKRKFFTQIKSGWQEKKNELKRKTPPKAPSSKKEQYAKLKAPQSTIALEPRLRVAKTNSKELSNAKQYIISTPNSEQTDELRINFFPHNFFEQETPYSYPVVKMPKQESFLKLPRIGRAQGKGFKEQDFLNALKRTIKEIDIADDFHLTIPFFNRPYEPDIVLFDKELNLYIDIEIDEPYDGYYRFPTHEVEKDDTRDLFFTESGWVVIRFTERQIHQQEKACISFIADVLNSIRSYNLEITSDCVREEQWTYSQAIRWEKEHYRENYLDINRFNKRTHLNEISVSVDEFEGIESNLNRTKKIKTFSQQDTIAFEDETHIYHHPKDNTGNAQYISVTTLIDRFFSFDIDRYIEGKAAKEGRDPKEVLDEFLLLRDEAAEKGTAMHENIEHYLLGKSHSTVSKEFDLFTKFYQEIILKFGFEFYEAEKRILLEEFNIAGTVDAIFKKPNSDEYILLDWKRSKKLVVDGHPRKFGYGFALSELQHLDNSSYYKYALQQNIYKYILERNYGLKISSMNLIVLHENYNNYYRVDLPNLQREIMIIFNSINHKI